MALVIDSRGLEQRKAVSVWERSRDLANAAQKHDWETNFVTVAPDGNRPTNTLEAQLGRPLDRCAFEQRLKACNPNLFTEVSVAFPDKAGIYIMDYLPDDQGILRRQKRFITGMMNGYMPEFSVRHTADETVPNPSTPGEMTTRKKFVGETRGWRTVLATLIRSKLIALESAKRVYEIGNGPESRNWQALTT